MLEVRAGKPAGWLALAIAVKTAFESLGIAALGTPHADAIAAATFGCTVAVIVAFLAAAAWLWRAGMGPAPALTRRSKIAIALSTRPRGWQSRCWPCRRHDWGW